METCIRFGCASLPFAASQCHCGACHRTFTGVTPFDRHQRLTDEGVICLDPEMARGVSGQRQFGVWRATSDGRPVWGRALRPGETLDGRSGRGRDAESPAEPAPV